MFRFEQKLDKNKRDLVKHLETTHGKLASRINHLEKKTRDQISGMSNSMKEGLAQERMECQDRMERRAIRDRIAIDRNQAMKHNHLKSELAYWLDHRMKSLEESAANNEKEQAALMRTLLRGSKRRKRAIRSELTSGNFRRALSEDEMEDEDQDLDHDGDDSGSVKAHDGLGVHGVHGGHELGRDLLEATTVQSEFGFPIGGHHHHFTTVNNSSNLEDRLRGLSVSDHPRSNNNDNNLNLYQNTSEMANLESMTSAASMARPVPSVRVRRNSAGDETMLFCDFGDFNTQELISSPVDHATDEFQGLLTDPGSPPISFTNSAGGGNPDVLSYSTMSESQSFHSNGSLLPRPIPYTPTSSMGGAPPISELGPASNRIPPLLPPKSTIPPPYRPPPQQLHIFHQSGVPPSLGPRPQTHTGPLFVDDDPFSHAHHHKGHTLVGGGALSSSDGGSHDSHNDSGYCAVRGSGGPSPSLSGKISRENVREKVH